MTTLTRRQLLKPLAALGPAMMPGTPVWAQSAWPNRPIKMVVPFPPGGSSDGLGRLVADKLAKQLDANFIVENKPGGTTQIGTELVAHAPPDGNTLLLAASLAFTQLPVLRSKLPFTIDDFEIAGGISAYLPVMAVRKGLPIKDMKQFIAYAKEHPGKLSFGSAGEASAGHVYGLTLARDTSIKVLHVPFRGSAAAVTALLAGDIDFIIDGAITPMVKADKVQPLAVLYSRRHPELPQVPTIKEAGYNVTSPTSSGWSLLAPKGTPAPVMARLSDELQKLLRQSDVAEALARANSVPDWQTPTEYRQNLRDDQKMYGELLPSLGITTN